MYNRFSFLGPAPGVQPWASSPSQISGGDSFHAGYNPDKDDLTVECCESSVDIQASLYQHVVKSLGILVIDERAWEIWEAWQADLAEEQALREL